MDLGTNIINFSNNADYLNLNTSLNKNYVAPHASAYGSYRFSKTKNIWINYNYNYDVPSARQILPVEDLANPLNTFVGNPNLELEL